MSSSYKLKLKKSSLIFIVLALAAALAGSYFLGRGSFIFSPSARLLREDSVLTGYLTQGCKNEAAKKAPYGITSINPKIMARPVTEDETRGNCVGVYAKAALANPLLGQWVTARGYMMNGYFYAKTIEPARAPTSSPEPRPRPTGKQLIGTPVPVVPNPKRQASPTPPVFTYSPAPLRWAQ